MFDNLIRSFKIDENNQISNNKALDFSKVFIKFIKLCQVLKIKSKAFGSKSV